MPDRVTNSKRDVYAGCHVCSGYVARWVVPQAQGTAARHCDATGHATWAEVHLHVNYGTRSADPRQIDIEDAIASVSLGDAPECAALPDLDASTVPAADVSAPVGRSSKPALAAAKPETTHA